MHQADGSVKDEVRGATVRDRLSGKQWDIRAKVVVNATGWKQVSPMHTLFHAYFFTML